MKQPLFSKRFFRYLPCVICASFMFPLQADDSGYIDAVMADMEEFTTGNFEPPLESTWTGLPDSQTDKPGASYEKLEDFSFFLKEKSPGSFIFYSKLPKTYQSRLHQEYLTTGNLEEIKQNIFKYSSEVKEQSQP